MGVGAISVLSAQVTAERTNFIAVFGKPINFWAEFLC